MLRSAQVLQAADFKRLMGQIHESIPLVCLCGNHDGELASQPKPLQNTSPAALNARRS